MVQSFGSVDFVYTSNTSAVVLLGSDYLNFTNFFCVPESIMNVSTDVLGYAAGFTGNDNTVISISFDRLSRTRIDLPERCFVSIIDEIRRLSSRIVHQHSENRNMVFESCGHVRRTLEPIQIRFVNLETGGLAEGQLVVEPSDYFYLIESDDTCELLIGNTGEEEVVVVDILRMRINIRFTRDQVSLCDSNSL
jgi:hypothetical protein